MQDVRLLEPAT